MLLDVNNIMNILLPTKDTTINTLITQPYSILKVGKQPIDICRAINSRCIG